MSVNECSTHGMQSLGSCKLYHLHDNETFLDVPAERMLLHTSLLSMTATRNVSTSKHIVVSLQESIWTA